MKININKYNIIILILILIKCINGFNVKTSTIIEKETNVLGVEFDYALMDLEFDREIYRVKNVPCGNFDCELPIIDGNIDCSCDYTGESGECPKPLDVKCNKTCDITYCDSLNGWETIKANEPKNFEVFNFNTLEIRYKSNAFICEGIRIEGLQNQGRFYISVSKDPLGRFVRSTPNIAPDTFIQPAFCPSDNGFFFNGESIDIWNLDTYFINIYSQSNYINFNLTIISKEIPPISKLPTTECTNLIGLNDHTCIVDGVPVSGETQNSGEFVYYTYNVTKPSIITFSAPSIFQDIDFFVSDDKENIYPDYNNLPKWECISENDDYLTLSLRPNDDGTPKTLYIGVSTFYASVYSFTVTSLGYKELVPINDGFPRGTAFSLLASSRLVLPNNSYYKCNIWSACTYFTILFPFIESFPVWPIPTQFIEDYRFNQITYYNTKSRPNHYSAAFLLSTTEGDFSQMNKDFKDLLDSKIEFLNTLVDKDGNPLEGIYSFKKNEELKCNFEEFKLILEEMDSQEGKLYNNTDFGAVNSIIFNIDTLTLSDSWKACSDRASSYLVTNDQMVNKSLSICSYSPNDAQYDSDPCCNVTLSFFECCVPKMVPVKVSDFIGVHTDLISDQCFSTACTESVLNEYYNSLSVVSECDVPAFVSTNSALEMREALRDCKQKLKSTPCTSDKQCGTYGPDNTTVVCDLGLRVCMLPPDQADLKYLECVFNRLPASYTYTFLNKYEIQVNASLITNIFNAMSWDDCTYISGTGYRTSYSYYTNSIDDSYVCYETSRCLDFSCQTVHDSCFDGQIGGWQFGQESNVDRCSELGFCPIYYSGIPENCIGDIYPVPQECIDSCNAVKNFCGHCSTDLTDCYNFEELTNSSQCTSNLGACLLPNGMYELGVDANTCETDYGTCTQPCGHECVGNYGDDGPGFIGCGIAELVEDEFGAYLIYLNETTCSEFKTGAVYVPEFNICQYTLATTEEQCKALSTSGNELFSWIDCMSKPSDECYDPIFGSSVCKLLEIPCQNQQQCENVGKCSDSFFFTPENVREYPENMGKCVHGHKVYLSGFYIPTCDTYWESDSPMGCFSYYPRSSQSSRDSCNAIEGFQWWSPATTEEECVAPMGCKIIDNSPYNLPYNFRFNEMTEDLCLGCGNDSFNSWEQKFTWTPAVWNKGIPVKPQWRENKYVHSGITRKVLDYQRLYEELDNSVNTHIADLYRSEVLCRMERVEGNLRSISCSCSENGSSECFSSSSLLLGQSKPCAGEESSYTFSFGKVEFNKTSVHSGCTSVLVSQVSQQLYKSTTPQTLSSNFVSYKKPNNYGVLNDLDAIIGTILGDGVSINTQGVTQLTICLQFNGTKYSKSYDIYDFAMSTPISQLRPLEVETFVQTSADGSELLCSNLNDFSEEKTFFPIVRLDSWVNKEKEVFDGVATALIYTLGGIFVITSLWGTFQCVMVGIKKYKGIEQIRLVHSLILIVTIFITIRAIYFFIIPSGALANNASGDYILVVLPTFIYFTAFTIIISLWYMIVNSRESGKRLFQRLKAIILITNVVLYLLFIVIVLVFNFTEDNNSNDCGTRIVKEVSNTTSQRVVSIVYAIIQALISLVIGGAFIYLGGSLFLSMRAVKPHSSGSTNGGTSGSSGSGGNSESNQHQKKIFIVTFACSIGFIIHCVFVLILVGANPSNITFSFLGLIITEIIPSLSIFYCYNQGHFGGLKQFTNVVELSYVTPNHENFNSKSSAVSGSRRGFGDSSISKNYSSQSSYKYVKG